MKALKMCANGCGVPPSPPSKVLCRACIDPESYEALEADYQLVCEERDALLGGLRDNQAEVTRVATERDRLREIVMGAHAIRCACGDHLRSTEGQWDMRDARCIALQALAAPQAMEP